MSLKSVKTEEVIPVRYRQKHRVFSNSNIATYRMQDGESYLALDQKVKTSKNPQEYYVVELFPYAEVFNS